MFPLTTVPRLRRKTIIAVVLLFVIFQLFTTSKQLHENKSTEDKSSPSKWHPSMLAAQNISSMMEVPESEYYTAANDNTDCPVHFYVYQDLLTNFTSHLEDLAKHHKSENVQTELALVRLFRTSPCRTTANTTVPPHFMIVPYLHGTHCITAEGYALHCQHIPWKTILQNILQNLTFWEDDMKKDQHVFLLGWGTYMSNKWLQQMPLTLTMGPKGKKLTSSSAIIIPPINSNPAFQPSALRSMPEEWWTQPQKYSFSF